MKRTQVLLGSLFSIEVFDMKKILATLFLFATFAVQVQTANAMSYDEAIKQPKPMVLLIYADWAEGLDKVNQNFDNAQKQ